MGCRQSHKCYNITVQSTTISGRIKVTEKCNGFVVVNKGDTAVTVNNFPLKPYPAGHPEVSGESYGVSGNADEEYKGNIDISFSTPLGANPLVVVVQKYFID